MLYWWSKYRAPRPAAAAVLPGPTIEGLEHVPARGGAILASNHLAVADSFFLPLLVPRRITFLAKREYFTQPGLHRLVQEDRSSPAWGRCRWTGPAGRRRRPRMDTAIRLLREGKLLGIYPEGTRSPDGRLYKGKTGVARMALEAGVPVIPVAMIGTTRSTPSARGCGARTRCTSGSASRWTSPATRAWPATGSSSAR